MKQLAIQMQNTFGPPVKVRFIWCFYLNTPSQIYLLWHDDEKVLKNERHGCYLRHGAQAISDAMRKPFPHLAMIVNRGDQLIHIGEN